MTENVQKVAENAIKENIKNINYQEVLNSMTKFNQENIVGKYLPIMITLLLSLTMYFIGFLSDCFSCGPFRALVLFIYIFGLSSYLLVQTTITNCKDSLKYINEIKLAGLCTAVFAVSYIILPFLINGIPFMKIATTFGPGKVLIPTFLGLIPYYFVYIYAEQQNLQNTCSNKDYNLF